MGVPKPIAYLGWTIFGLTLVGATTVAADLSNVSFKSGGITIGILSNDAPEIGGWIQEGRRISEERSGGEPPAVDAG